MAGIILNNLVVFVIDNEVVVDLGNRIERANLDHDGSVRRSESFLMISGFHWFRKEDIEFSGFRFGSGRKGELQHEQLIIVDVGHEAV